MNAKVLDLMTESVITVEPDATIDRVRHEEAVKGEEARVDA